ncbi:hypothetical protein AVEN_148190-1 [Araneus ventricosus]|uniref:Uncharacterized protein n=1 Tax=Araneus ventricosus TaxID=182803 RepID=A0A4Y2DCA3_ARAVE|nr:hypothetical protein AVEN_148190-1 [Araneus ventricosus]
MHSLATCVSDSRPGGGEFQTKTLRDDAIWEGFVGPFLRPLSAIELGGPVTFSWEFRLFLTTSQDGREASGIEWMFERRSLVQVPAHSFDYGGKLPRIVRGVLVVEPRIGKSETHHHL